MIDFVTDIFVGYSSDFDDYVEYYDIVDECRFLKYFIEDNESLIKGTVPANDGESLFWFGRALWHTIHDAENALSLQSRAVEEENFVTMLEYLKLNGHI